MTKQAALYLRSSKDRSDIAISQQQRELEELARKKGLEITQIYTDVVESAKDERRPAFQRLLLDLGDSNRGWTYLLMQDTSRLSRKRYMAQVFKHTAKKKGIKIMYSRLPEADSAMDTVLEGMMEIFDELHSMMSKEKGLAGMAENVKQGFRAGGRPPSGYRLEHFSTGAIRDGEPVTKTKLQPNHEASVYSRYLKGRAQGRSRKSLKNELGITMGDSSLVGIEWNALTYAGHTAWNVRNERIDGRCAGGKNRRPREEWLIEKNTHQALISDTEAEKLLHNLENSSHSQGRRTSATYLFTGKLKTPEGEPWYGNGGGKQYRTKGERNRYVNVSEVDTAILNQIATDLCSTEFIQTLILDARKQYGSTICDPTADLRKQIQEKTQKISKLVNVMLDMTEKGPAKREIEKIECELTTLKRELQRIEKENNAADIVSRLDNDYVSAVLANLADELTETDRETTKDTLGTMIDQIILDPVSMDCRIHYQIAVDGRNSMASPRGFEPLLPG